MESYSMAAMERAMKVQDVILQALGKKITWYQAAEIIRRLEVGAAEVEARARAAMEDAANKLQNAERCIKDLQADRLEMEQRLHDTSRRAKETEDALREAQQRLAATESQLFAMEMRVKASDAHALKAKQALIRVEDAIRTHLLDVRNAPKEHRPSAAA